jgi:hypothetical protein
LTARGISGWGPLTARERVSCLKTLTAGPIHKTSWKLVLRVAQSSLCPSRAGMLY